MFPPIMLFLGQHWFTPGRDSSNFGIWWKNKLYRFCDISYKGQIMTKLQLELKYNTAILWFQEFEIYHMFKFSLNRELITFETILEDSKSGVKG